MASASIRTLANPGMSSSRPALSLLLGRRALASPRSFSSVAVTHLARQPLLATSKTPSLASQSRYYSVQNPQATNPTSIPSQSSSSGFNEGDAKYQSEPEPTGAYARFKLLAKKYGWYAFGMYWILSTVDFTLSFLVVHSLGAERIEPVISSSLHTYRVWRHGEEETKELEEGDRQRREEVKAEEKKGGGGYWGSRMFWAEALLAYTIHKTALLPFRAGLTVAWTPKVVKWLRARGWAGKVGLYL